MEPSKKSREEMILWLAGILEREMRSELYGTVTVHMEAGRVVRTQTARNEIPPKWRGLDKPKPAGAG